MKTRPEHPHQALRVGITGGIGSGKTTVCKIFESLGIPVYYADDWAKWLLNNDPALKAGVVQIFGAAAYTSDGQYNRTFVAAEAFSNPDKLKALNALAHPAVEQHALAWHEAAIAKGAPYSLKEAALMIESGSFRHLDFMMVVTAPEQLRIDRVVQRDQVTEDQVRQRIARQMPESEKIKLADAVIVNDGNHPLVQQVWEIHQKLLQKIRS